MIRLVSFLRLLPDDIPAPEASWESDGYVSLDWIISQTCMFSLSIGDSEWVAYAWTVDGTSGHAKDWFDGCTMPFKLIEHLRAVVTKQPQAASHKGMREIAMKTKQTTTWQATIGDIEYPAYVIDSSAPAGRQVVACVVDREHAPLLAMAPKMLAVLKGCRDALREAGKDFALHNPMAARPNLYELRADEADKAIRSATS